MRFIPAPGLKVRDPRTREFIPAEGLEVADGDLALQRLVRAGDLVAAPAAPQAASVAAPQPSGKSSPQPAAADKGAAPTDEASA